MTNAERASYTTFFDVVTDSHSIFPPTITEIKQSIAARGGSCRKCPFTLNSNLAYEVDGQVMTWAELSARFVMGVI